MRTADVVSVFTRGETGGNLLGVVDDLDGLDEQSMQTIAAELGFSETIFLDHASDAVAVRIFTPATELPFAGHPLVGAAWTVGGTGTLRCRIGEIPFTADDDGAGVDVPLSTAVEQVPGTPIARSLGIPEPLAAWRVAMPLRYLIVDLGLAHAVLAAVPDIGALREAADVTMLLARDDAEDLVVARCFAPGLGVDEDPATGSAAVAYASVATWVGEPKGSVTIDQGDAMGHPSRIELAWREGRCRLGGTVRREGTRDLDH
ncbi:MAG: PhzF family phenazine biosynthesis protein [Acidimicrobiia bacterium]|nr:PhzF family phenazine biosynthesis protein [Acidimicrobiia bacterium]